ncbi:hypothetical protein BD626DRAFT_498333 [Schizophyllum amplum]|uniref:F-box domain-containing protein n=1 Tax=Schizophyllum amplum TaxID=97359 RepID=A0A550CD97_9AGAR|nr:hypothetical protein BD626DRAFT_498333 [Auriculariopsis ampla]
MLTGPASASAWSPIFQRVGNIAGHPGKTLNLRFDEMDIPGSSTELPLPLITVNHLEPLFRRTDVSTFALRACSAIIDDEFVDKVATAWPMLMSLDLGDFNPALQTPTMTLGGLTTLVRSCRRLSCTPTFPIDVSNVPAATVEESALVGGAWNVRVDSICVGNSPMFSNPAAVATYLSFLFPNLESILASVTVSEGWRQVEALLPFLKQAQRQGFLLGRMNSGNTTGV